VIWGWAIAIATDASERMDTAENFILEDVVGKMVQKYKL